MFGCKCLVLDNRKDNLDKFDAKDNEGLFLSYSISINVFQIYHKSRRNVHVIIDENNPKIIVEG